MERAEQVARAADVARKDVPVCALSDTVAEVREQLAAAGWDQCIVTTDDRIVLGRIFLNSLAGETETSVEASMEHGPSTFRPDVPVEQMLEHLLRQETKSAPITTPEGKLLGILLLRDANTALSNKTSTEVRQH
jgi:CBS domain-containing protein